MSMFKNFKPDHYYDSLASIDFGRFVHYDTIIFDYDNTLTGWNGNIPAEISSKIKELSKSFRLFVFSNGKQKRVQKSCQDLPLIAYGSCYKPRINKAITIITTQKIDPKKTIFVGDNMITDIWHAHRLGMCAILVDPLRKKEFVLTGVWRICERIIKLFITLEKDETQ